MATYLLYNFLLNGTVDPVVATFYFSYKLRFSVFVIAWD